MLAARRQSGRSDDGGMHVRPNAKRSVQTVGSVTAVILMLAAAAACAEAPPSFSRTVIFGDSLSDTGNVWSLTLGLAPASPPHYAGRFSDGPVWIERFAMRAGLDGTAAYAGGGSNFAHGGAKTGGGTVYLVVPNVGPQIDEYLAGNTPGADELFVVWAGGNDMLGGQTDPAVPVANLAGHVSMLAAQGARSFLVPNLPPLGQVPRYAGGGNEAPMDALTTQYNALLAQRMDALAAELDVAIVQFDVATTFSKMLADPAAFGLANVTDPAYDEDAGTVVPNPREYLFWDTIHPSATGHRMLGDAAFEAVYQPAGPGDANCDGRIDDNDLSLLLAHWSAGGGSISIPEPTTLTLIALAALGLPRRKSRSIAI